MPKVSDVYMEITKEPTTVNENDSLETIRKTLLENPVSRCVYVLNHEQRFIGIITVKEIITTIGFRSSSRGSQSLSLRNMLQYLSKDIKAKDIMRPPIAVKVEDSFQEAIRLMMLHGYEEIAVVDGENRLIGDLNSYEILNCITLDN
ncbi:hypothetical protein BHU72_01160 [Desulfuribacillus stibiiarsenatis]|uniref:CBS domain-containing protein n=1 Tax=Desulfuribacillus stibiiarsenatis TaxID=1390249 RepID=A0A1E5L9T5_9FIRM|nr:CBS domain-containing protein [Desulfuribacillus stibiiarsenatis]OEH86900.1 hypothetical protein BHU72_01160 [Desulfuribacillus stibiiarsenatis]